MSKNGNRNNEEKSIKRCDMLAARAALLDFYADIAVSFSNQFLASIFGLVASSAIIQSAIVYLLSNSKSLSFELLLFLFPSLLLFGGLSYMVRYTYWKFGEYSDLANNLVTGTDGIKETARLDQLYVGYKTKIFLSKKRELEEIYNNLIKKSKLTKETRMFIKYEEDESVRLVNYVVHLKFRDVTRAKIWWRKNFNKLMIGSFVVLAIVTYYPIIADLIRALGNIVYSGG